jgi:hypothetical protein
MARVVRRCVLGTGKRREALPRECRLLPIRSPGVRAGSTYFVSIRERVRKRLPEAFTIPPVRLIPLRFPLVAMGYWLWRIQVIPEANNGNLRQENPRAVTRGSRGAGPDARKCPRIRRGAVSWTDSCSRFSSRVA